MSLGDYNKVNVLNSVFSKRCDVRKCTKLAEFMVFTDDGETKSSRLFSQCCPNHLPKRVKEGNKWNMHNRNSKEHSK